MTRQTFELCHIDEIPLRGSRGFSVTTAGNVEDLFLVRLPSGVVAYRNSCPHTGGPLDWVPDQFLNLDGNLIQCATHDALFRIEDGACVKGPCVGRSLTAIPVKIERQRVSVILDAPGPAK
jgi:nitrite reductase/ring-hydroxylating ferredoxin subunit